MISNGKDFSDECMDLVKNKFDGKKSKEEIIKGIFDENNIYGTVWGNLYRLELAK